MQTHDNSLRAAIKDVGTMMRETASRSEAAALKAVDAVGRRLLCGHAMRLCSDTAHRMNAPVKTYRYYDFILGAFVCVLLCSNLIGPAKIAQIDLPWYAIRAS